MLNTVSKLCHIDKDFSLTKFSILVLIICIGYSSFCFSCDANFVSAQEELSKTDLLFQSYDNIFVKVISSEIEELFEKHIVHHLDNAKKKHERP